MEVVSLPGQLAACCADRQQLAYLIYYSTTVYHRNFALERQGFPQRVGLKFSFPIRPRRIFVGSSQQQDVFSAAQNDLSIPEKHLPLQGVGFLSGGGKPEEPAVSISP